MVAATTNNSNIHLEIINDKIKRETKRFSSSRKDLYIRTSWTDAAIALAQIEKVCTRLIP